MKVVIIGSGNVATVLGKIIQNSGHKIVQVISRNVQHAKVLADALDCGYGDYATAYPEADIYVLAITDSALLHLDQFPHLGNKVAVHTAGAVTRDVLSGISERYGVIYPLQSLNKALLEIPEVPLLIDADSADTLIFIQTFANTLSSEVAVATDLDRLKFHIAAVIVNNFTNHLYALAEAFCKQENIEFSGLFPLIHETAKRIQAHPPQELQTGPALRQDHYTVGRHLKMLSVHPDLKYIYLKLSESILKLHKIK